MFQPPQSWDLSWYLLYCVWTLGVVSSLGILGTGSMNILGAHANAFDVSSLGPGTQKGSRRTSQEGSWLHAGWKSNASQQEMKAEFTEGRERECRYRRSVWGNQKGKERESPLCLRSRAFIEDCGPLYMSSQASGTG